MEVETACRFRLPITFVIVNNNGIGGGLSEYDQANPPPFVYTLGARYEKIIEAFGGRGFCVERVADLAPTLKEAIADPMPNIVNILIDPKAQRKPQKFEWLTH
jgi:thiamine pyrophosphate-dependent acetolactate synthase large subunit-like protein